MKATPLTAEDIATIVRFKIANPSYGYITIATKLRFYTAAQVYRAIFNHYQSIEALEAITAETENITA